jgi:hypothetical protein
MVIDTAGEHTISVSQFD